MKREKSMSSKMVNCLFNIACLACASAFFFACSNADDGVRVQGDCPEGAVCDTVNAKAYSFVYYSGKNKLDTITETTDNLACDIWNDYFECTLRKFYSCFRFEYLQNGEAVVMPGKERPVEHQVRVGDTTYINYGPQRLSNYIPPYIEIPPFNAKKLQDAFDTVVVEKKYSDYWSGESKTYFDFYDLDHSRLTEWAYASSTAGKVVIFDGKDGTPLADTTIVSLDGYTVSLTVYSCNYTSFIKFPQKLVGYKSSIHVFADTTEVPKNDTTITWMAHYSDMYGVEDSTEITTFFKIKKPWKW